MFANFAVAPAGEVLPGEGARHCRCRQKERRELLMAKARLPKRYDDCSFHNFSVPETDESGMLKRSAVNDCQSIVREYPILDMGLLLMGPCGVGKDSSGRVHAQGADRKRHSLHCFTTSAIC